MNKRIFSLLLILIAGCSNQGTETGNPSMHIQFSSYSQPTVSRVDLCVHQIRFKTVNSSDDTGENANISIGVVTFNPAGTSVAPNVTSVKTGLYRRVDVMVKDGCGTGISIAIQNGNGIFSTNRPLILRFIGELPISIDVSSVILGVEPFTGFFGTVTSDSQLENGVESINGEI